MAKYIIEDKDEVVEIDFPKGTKKAEIIFEKSGEGADIIIPDDTKRILFLFKVNKEIIEKYSIAQDDELVEIDLPKGAKKARVIFKDTEEAINIAVKEETKKILFCFKTN